MTEHTTHYEDCGCLRARYEKRIAELETRNEVQRVHLEKLLAELAALKERRCETCKDSSQTEHGDFCCEIGLEMVDYEPFPDGFSCSEWETRP